MQTTSLCLVIVCVLLFGTSRHGQPARAKMVEVAQVALVNAASYEAVVAPGSIGALFGVNLTAQTQSATTLPLPLTLGGISVRIAGKAAPLFFVSPSQINLQVPSSVSVGTATVEVFNAGGASVISTGTVTVAEAAPGIFTVGATGRGQAIALNADYSSNGTFELSGARPEAAGSYVSIFATGIGSTSSLIADGQAAPGSPVITGVGATSVTIGGMPAPVLFSGLAPGLVGLWQLNVLLPDTLPTELATSLRVTKSRTSSEATLAIASRNEYGTVSGNVMDGLSGGPLRNATVALAQAGQATRAAVTDAQGVFTFQVVRTGGYTLEAAAAGFRSGAQTLSAVNGQTAVATLTLTKQSPNIIVIIADDLGYADLGIQGSTEIVSPHLDSIAKNGIRFTNAYVSAAVCAPTRAGFLTGRYQQRFGNELLPATGDLSYGLSVHETTLATRLKALGYATSLVGKWHLGLQGEFLPQQRGFDEFFGFLAGAHSYTQWNQPSNPIYRGTQTVNETTYLTDAFTREAVDFIQRKQAQPFYLQLAFNAPHEPLQATAEYLARFPNIADADRRTFAAMVAALDDGVGQVLAKLRELNLEENTLVIFFSDNGGLPSGNTSKNTPLNGQKDQLLEGGIRTPAMLQWKGYLPAGVVNQAPIIALDYFPTVLAAALGRKFADATLDGVNLIPYLTGVETAVPHEQLFWRSGERQYAVRVGDWKLVLQQNTTRLYHLAADPAETTNLADANPAKFNELKAIYDQWNAQLPPAPR